MSSVSKYGFEALAEAIVAQAADDYRSVLQGKPIYSIPQERVVMVKGVAHKVELSHDEWVKTVRNSCRRTMKEIEQFFDSDLFKSMSGTMNGKDLLKQIRMSVGIDDEDYPMCPKNRKSCFAYMSGGRCWSLKDTDFKGKPCPFYKDMSEVSSLVTYKKSCLETRRKTKK